MVTQAADTHLFDHMTVLSDPLRCRLLGLLEQHALSVSDLCAVLQLPQSTVSRHLKALADGGWLTSSPDGTRRLYRGTVEQQPDAARDLWALARAAIEPSAGARHDRQRLQSVLARPRSRSQDFFDASSARWDTLRQEMFGGTLPLSALLGLLPATWRVADLGCGTGTVCAALAPFVRLVIGVDQSAAMLELAAQRTRRFDNVELRNGQLEELPLEDGCVDAATFVLVLHHVQQPEAAIREAARCLRPGGRVLIVDMLPHDRTQYRHEMGHVWLGFSQETMCTLLEGVGLREPRWQVLPPDPEATGPNLFAVSASLESESA
jgi:ArsR family transcriptional regulator